MWKEIKEKYPKAYEAFGKWIDEYKKEVKWAKMFNQVFSEDYIAVAPKFHDLPFELQIGVLEQFFDENGLYIFAHKDYAQPPHWYWKIKIEANEIKSSGYIYENTRQAAQTSAFQKGFEILDKRLWETYAKN